MNFHVGVLASGSTIFQGCERWVRASLTLPNKFVERERGRAVRPAGCLRGGESANRSGSREERCFVTLCATAGEGGLLEMRESDKAGGGRWEQQKCGQKLGV